MTGWKSVLYHVIANVVSGVVLMLLYRLLNG